MVGGNASKSVAEGGTGYFVQDGRIAEASIFLLPLFDFLLNPALRIALFGFSNFDTAHDDVDYVKSG